MKIEQKKRSVAATGVMQQAGFGLSESLEDQSHILSILRDRLYTDKVLAVLREYSANAWDAHVDGGCPDKPIKVVLPTNIEPSLVIRDYGTGLSESDVFNVYVKYGASTKRDANRAVGSFGIGAKSAFAYNDSFTVTSWHGGMKKVYVGVLDESNVGIMTKVHEEACGDEVGVEIKIAVNPGDVYQFRDRAKYLYPFFRPLPSINMELGMDVGRDLPNGFIRNRRDYSALPQWVAVMGCIPYRINFSVVCGELEEAGVKVHEKVYGGIRFEIGEVDITANREEIEYTAKTKKAIVAKLKKLSEEIWDVFSDDVRKKETGWAKRMLVRKYVSDMALSIPKEHKHLAAPLVPLYDKADPKNAPETFTIHEVRKGDRSSSPWHLAGNHNIRIDDRKKLIIRDTENPLKGHIEHLWPMEVIRVLVPKPKCEAKDVEKELKDLLKKIECDGVKVEKISSYAYTPPSANRSSSSPKHSRKYFTLKEDFTRYTNTKSENWEIFTGRPPAGSVCVAISRFVPNGYPMWRLERDKFYLKSALGVDMPKIFGVKTTASHPVDNAKIIERGWVPYVAWRDSVIPQAMAVQPEAWESLEMSIWRSLSYKFEWRFKKQILEYLKENLDGRHSIIKAYQRVERGMRPDKKIKEDNTNYLRKIIKEIEGLNKEAEGRSEAIQRTFTCLMERYPLLDKENHGPGLDVFANSSIRDEWLLYIYMIDSTQ